VGIVAEFQVKKMKKMQDEVRQEEATLQTKHLARLRAAAAEAAAKDTSALNSTSGWLNGSGSEEEESMVGHWQGVLDGLWEDRVVPEGSGEVWAAPVGLPGADSAPDAAGTAATAAVDENGGDSLVRKGHYVQLPGGKAPRGARDAAGAGAAAEARGSCVRYTDPYHQQHHTRLALEALRELGSMWIPAGLMLKHGVLPSVRRFLSYPQRDVAESAERVLERWRRQLVGHLHVLGCAEYMVDGVGRLEEEIRLQRVPLPQLPRPKQVGCVLRPMWCSGLVGVEERGVGCLGYVISCT
jgi:hypothetical protein